MMSKFDNLPAVISQAIEGLLNPTTPERIKFNYIQTLERVRDGCNAALDTYNRKQKKK